LESVSIRRIQGVGYGILGVSWSRDHAQIRRIFLDGYGVLVFRTVIFKISPFKLQNASYLMSSAAKRAIEKRNKPPIKAQQRQIMFTYLKNMEGYKLKDLKSKVFDSIQEMFDRAFKKVNTFEDFITELVEGK
ncbi:hypothetical protein Tco_0049836, partial [Tanacetum coccineum]